MILLNKQKPTEGEKKEIIKLTNMHSAHILRAIFKSYLFSIDVRKCKKKKIKRSYKDFFHAIQSCIVSETIVERDLICLSSL